MLQANNPAFPPGGVDKKLMGFHAGLAPARGDRKEPLAAEGGRPNESAG